MSTFKNIVTFSIIFTFVFGSSIIAYAEETPQAPGPTDSSGPQEEIPATTDPAGSSAPQTDPGAGSVTQPGGPRVLPPPVPKKYPKETPTVPAPGVKKMNESAKPVRSGEVQATKKEIQGIRDDRRESVVEEKKDVRNDIKAIRDDVKNGSTTREEAREDAKKRLEDGRAAISAEREKARGEIEIKRTEIKNEIERTRADRLAKISEMYMKRYLAAYDRLINIKDRVSAHIEKIETKGQDATTAKTELDKATPLLAKALTTIDELKTALTDAANNPTNETLKKTSQEKAELAKTALKEAHAALIKVVEVLKPAKPSGTATSSRTI